MKDNERDYYCKDGWVIDGESWSPSIPFEELGGIMRAWKNPKEIPADLALNVFDILTLEQWNNGGEPVFSERVKIYTDLLKKKSPNNCNIIVQQSLKDIADAQKFYDKCVEKGHEGMMLRDPDGRYKHGRCTLNEYNIIKLKQWITTDVWIVDYEQATKMKEEYANSDRGKDETGHSKRSRTKENYELVDAIGSIIVEDEDGVKSGVHFSKEYNGPEVTWANRKKFIGKMVEVRSMKVGVKDGLRLGGITRFREDKDEDR